MENVEQKQSIQFKDESEASKDNATHPNCSKIYKSFANLLSSEGFLWNYLQ